MATILVVDDEAGMRQVILNVLKNEGHTLLSAEDGFQAIELVKNSRPDMVMLDMRLPDMDGIEILSEIKRIQPQTHVIMMTGFGDIESALGAMKQGAFNYVSKPFKVTEVLAIVRKALGKTSKPDDAASHGAAPLFNAGANNGHVKKFKRLKSSTVVYNALAITAICIALCFYYYFGVKVKNEVFTVRYANPTSITYDGKHLWITDWVTESFYQHNTDGTLSVRKVFFMQDSHPTGVTFDGSFLWSSNSWEKAIYKHKLDDALTVVATYQSPGQEPSGLYWDGIYLWVCDLTAGKIFKTRVSDEGLTVINEYDSPGSKPVGLFAAGKFLWTADAATNTLYKMNRDFTVEGVYKLPQFDDQTNRLTGLAWDGRSLWTCCDENKKIFRNTLSSLRPLKF